MKYLYLNLKRFDIPRQLGGVNSIAPISDWAAYIVKATEATLQKYSRNDVHFVMYFPEAHILNAAAARSPDSPIKLGCQGVYREDTSIGGKFGAFTTNHTANSVRALGCESAIIGHCEERNDISEILAEAGVKDFAAINRLLNKSVLAAQAAGLDVLYCIGETAEQQERWQEILERQLTIGLAGADLSRVTIAYEPIWSIGPGKTPADAAYIEKITRFVKEKTSGIPVVYGGGLKTDNAKMLASIKEVDGGLVALTRFTGDIGFYPEEYLQTISDYLVNKE